METIQNAVHWSTGTGNKLTDLCQKIIFSHFVISEYVNKQNDSRKIHQ